MSSFSLHMHGHQTPDPSKIRCMGELYGWGNILEWERWLHEVISLTNVQTMQIPPVLLPLSRNSTTFTKSSSFSPRDVRAGVPSRMPLGFRADLSPGIVFLLTAMLASSRILSTRTPLVWWERKSMSSKWLSVPPGKTFKDCKGLGWFCFV